MVAYIETKNNINDLKLAAMNDMECNTQVIESNNTMVKENDLQSACEYATHLVCNLGFDHYKAVNALLKEGLDNETAEMVEKLAPRIISGERTMYKGVSANVDFYSGFVYQMLGIPEELFTPIFAIARISGWCAHRIEELLNGNRIIRPAYRAVQPQRAYVPIAER